MKKWRKNRNGPPPYTPPNVTDTPQGYIKEARMEGFWWALVWPASLTFHALGATAFAKELAAEQATANAKVIADYDLLVAERFDEELAEAKPRRRGFRPPIGNSGISTETGPRRAWSWR